METLRVDRGLELNKRRLNRDSTDVKFIVQDQVFFAHRLIVGLHSDYLRLLIDPNLPFTERYTHFFLCSISFMLIFSPLKLETMRR